MNTRNEFEQLQDHFHQLESLSAAEREKALAELSQHSPKLYTQLAAMFDSKLDLTHREKALEGLVDVMRADVDDELGAAQDLTGRSYGSYTLSRLLGEGGMGQVYLAEQAEPIKRTVALKLARRGLDSRTALARFRLERQALAVLEHANIARVFDAGSDEEGRPWFAMEYIDGLPINRWAQQVQLNLIQRVELMLPVCEAVQHAHRKGLIHRDLKPSNILVEADQGIGNPRVIDFGIAKLIDFAQADKSFATSMGELIGTPEYMSPEQAALGDIDLDTRADVYALGLVLYELLTGQLPHSSEDLRSLSFAQMCKLIREKDCPLASVIASESGDPLSAKRAIQLKGDLDAVLQKALAKDRDQRYDSVSAFADDLRRYLNKEPVQAQAPSAWYKMRKFAQRHRVGVLTSAAALLALLVSVAVANIGLVQAKKSEAAAVQSAQTAELERQSAQASTRFMVELFQSADPRNQPGLELTAKELLQRGVERVENLSKEPTVQAEILAALGDVYWSLGDSDLAEPLLRRSLKLREENEGADSLKQVNVLNRLSGLLRNRNDYEEAESLQRKALAVLTSNNALGSPEEVTVLNNLGLVLVRTNQLDEAEKVYGRAIELMEINAEKDPDAHQDWRSNVANLLGNLASVHNSRGNYAGAIDSSKRALQIFKTQLPENHPRLAALHNNLAFFYAAMGRYSAALSYAQNAVAINRVAMPDAHPTLAANLLNLGQIQTRIGQFAQAEKTLQSSLEMYRETLGDDNYDLTRPIGWLGVLAFAQHDFPLAEKHNRDACERMRISDHPLAKKDLALCQRRLAILMLQTGSLDAADQSAQQALLLAQTLKDSDGIALAQLIQAQLAAARGNQESANNLFQTALTQAQCADAPCALDQTQELITRAHWWLAQNDFAQAASALQYAIAHSKWTPWLLDDARFAPLKNSAHWPVLQKSLAARVAADESDADIIAH